MSRREQSVTVVSCCAVVGGMGSKWGEDNDPLLAELKAGRGCRDSTTLEYLTDHRCSTTTTGESMPPVGGAVDAV